MKATFEQELEVAKSITEQIPAEAIALPSQADLAENAQISGLAAHYPTATIEVENKLREISRCLGQKYPNMQRTLQTLIERNTLNSEASALFQSLKRARNSAAHGDIESSTVSRNDAIEYASQATFLIRLLDEAARKL